MKGILWSVARKDDEYVKYVSYGVVAGVKEEKDSRNGSGRAGLGHLKGGPERPSWDGGPWAEP